MSERFRRQLRHVLVLLRAEDYMAVASDPRFRASERRLVWQASRAAMLVIAIAAPLHIVAFSLLHPADWTTIAAVTAALGSAALAAWWLLGRWLRHEPELVAFVMSLAVAAATMALTVFGPRFGALTIGYLLFLPTLVALVLPWRSWTEIRWLAIYGILVILYLSDLGPNNPASATERADLVFGLVVVLVSAFTGHVLIFRQRVRGFVQVQALRRLQRHESRQRAELERVYKALEVTARTDQLTGVGNRLKLDEDLRIVRGRLARTGLTIGLLEVDLDHFKGVNDAFGHPAGDEVLRQVARTLSATTRADDAVYRYGGEEFLVVLGAVAGDIREAAERVRRAVEDLGITHPSNPPFGIVTISVGAGEIGAAEAAESDGLWFARVDAALYQAKAAGRNRVAVAPAAGSRAPATARSVKASRTPLAS